MLPELRLIRALVGINLASAMEYRVSFISQIIGMAVNNGVMLVFWFIFFDRFGTIEGYAFEEMFLLFGLVALSYGVAHTLAGNIGGHLAYLIAQGRLDYYLVFPRRLLPHILFSRMQISAVGDLLFGLVCVALAIGADGWRWVWALLGTGLAAAVIVAYGVIAGSLSFFMGNSQNASHQMMGSLVTFGLYPMSFFSGGARLVLFTLLPAGFIGAVPVQLVQEPSGRVLLGLLAATAVFWLIAITLFQVGLRRYESGNALNVNV